MQRHGHERVRIGKMCLEQWLKQRCQGGCDVQTCVELQRFQRRVYWKPVRERSDDPVKRRRIPQTAAALDVFCLFRGERQGAASTGMTLGLQ
jgi:hypothetical protein